MRLLAILVGIPILLIVTFFGAGTLGYNNQSRNKTICKDKGGQLIMVDGTRLCAKLELVK